MKNITVAIDDATHRAARLHAAAHGTSISALVKAYLAQLANGSPNDPTIAQPSFNGVRDMHASFSTPWAGSVVDAPSLPATMVWTKDGKPRQPGALRGTAGLAVDDLAGWSPDVLDSFTAWDEDAFDPLP